MEIPPHCRTASFPQKSKDNASYLESMACRRLHRALVKAWKRAWNLGRKRFSGSFSARFSTRPVEDAVLAFRHMARERILLIEDEPDIAEVLQYNLEKEGFQVEIARRGDAGLEAIRRDGPDLILLDLMLPGIDGLELTRLLKRDPAHGSPADRDAHRARRGAGPHRGPGAGGRRLHQQALQPARGGAAGQGGAAPPPAARGGRRGPAPGRRHRARHLRPPAPHARQGDARSPLPSSAFCAC